MGDPTGGEGTAFFPTPLALQWQSILLLHTSLDYTPSCCQSEHAAAKFIGVKAATAAGLMLAPWHSVGASTRDE